MNEAQQNRIGIHEERDWFKRKFKETTKMVANYIISEPSMQIRNVCKYPIRQLRQITLHVTALESNKISC